MVALGATGVVSLRAIRGGTHPATGGATHPATGGLPQLPLGSFTKIKPSLAKLPSKFDGGLAKLGLISPKRGHRGAHFVQEAICTWLWAGEPGSRGSPHTGTHVEQ